MRELMQDLYASDTHMSIVPFGDSLLVKFHHNVSKANASYQISSYDLGDLPMSMEKYIRLLLDGFLKQVGDYRRIVR